MRVPVASTDLSGNEEQYVVNAIRSSWISSTGEYVSRFEREFAQNCETQTAVAVCNGTVALHLALLGLNVRPGDEVLVPSLTYIATANAVRYVGGEPVFVDVDPETWCIDPAKLEASVTRKTRGIIGVHLLGHPADMDAINRVAQTHGLWVVEDAAEATFAKYKGRTVGSLGQMATFSFFGNKLLTCGEGGAVTLSSAHLDGYLRILRGQGMDPQRRYYHPITGYNFRLTNVACAILCAQMERREEILRKRLAVFARYNEALAEVPGFGLQPVAPWAELSPWMYAATVDAEGFGCDRDTLISLLGERGVETRPMFVPLHTLPPFRPEGHARHADMPHTDRLGRTGIMLPTFTNLSVAEQDYVLRCIREVGLTVRARPAMRAA